MVASGIAKVTFSMIDNRVVPVGHINRPIGANLAIHWAKVRVFRSDQWLENLGTVAGPIFDQFIADNRAALEPAREQLPPNVRRQMSAGRQITAALFLRADQRGKSNALAAVT